MPFHPVAPQPAAVGRAPLPSLVFLNQLFLLLARVLCRSDSLTAGYAAVLHLRSATRVLQLIHQQQLDPSLPAGQTVSWLTML